MLPNQVPLPDAQVKRRAAKVWSREGVYPRGSPATSWEHKSQSCLPKGRGCGWSYLSDKAEAAEREKRRLGIRERRDNCSAQAQLSYRLPHQPHVLVFSERGVFDPLTSRGHWKDTHACPVTGSVVPIILNRLQLGTGYTWLRVPEKQLCWISYYLGYLRPEGHARFLYQQSKPAWSWGRLQM